MEARVAASRPPATKQHASAGVHYLYLAVILVLLVITVYFAASAYRAREVSGMLKNKYGVDAEIAGASRARPSVLRSLTAEQLLADRTFDQWRTEFDQALKRATDLGEFDDGSLGAGVKSDLRKACELAVGSGKRLRPIILMEIARLVSKRRHLVEQMPPVDPMDAALAVEYLHAASLVVDDSPNFDNDEERRGSRSVWKETSPATAMMAGLSISMGAFQNMCRQVDWLRAHCGEWINPDRVGTMLCNRVSQAMGIIGASSGQFMDMMPPSKLRAFAGHATGAESGDALAASAADGCAPAEDGDAPAADAADGDAPAADGNAPAVGVEDAADVPGSVVQTLVQRKTSPFFEIAFVGGWLVGGGETDRQIMEDLQRAGRDFGIAFQVADDIGDLEKDKARRRQGKPGWNYADAFGVEEAEAELVRRLAACRKTLVRYRLHSAIWEEIYAKVMKMTSA